MTTENEKDDFLEEVATEVTESKEDVVEETIIKKVSEEKPKPKPKPKPKRKRSTKKSIPKPEKLESPTKTKGTGFKKTTVQTVDGRPKSKYVSDKKKEKKNPKVANRDKDFNVI